MDRPLKTAMTTVDRRAKKALMAGWRPFSEGGSPMEQENFSLPIHGIWDLA